jgi:hypothetical protein
MRQWCIRLILLLAVVSMQSCCWSQCPQREISAVERHTGHGDDGGG